MKLKYYLRGLGIGVAVTALLMGFAVSKQKESLTDDEIRQRALEMGMIEQNGVLSEDLGTPEETGEEAVEEETAEEPVEEPVVEESVVEEPVVEEPVVEEPMVEESKEETAEETATEEPAQAEYKSITVNGGDGSHTVANKLQEAGLIEDAAEYDAYLCQNGYDKRITTGNHEIAVGATFEEIAKEITGR